MWSQHLTLAATEVTERKGRLRVIVKLNSKKNLSVSVIKLKFSENESYQCAGVELQVNSIDKCNRQAGRTIIQISNM